MKGRNHGRMIFNDQVAARLGRLMGAPVPEDAALVNVPQALIDLNRPNMDHVAADVGHGSEVFEDTTDRFGLQYTNEPENRPRFASLAVFFGWMGGSDHQYIYKKSAPHLVHSVDHGHFFNGGPNWTIGTLAAAPAAALHADIMNHCAITQAELAVAGAPLADVTAEQIAGALAAPPDDWGVGIDERVALAEYLHTRQTQMVAICGAAI